MGDQAAREKTNHLLTHHGIDIKELKGQLDFGIISIREDEFEAVLQRFSPTDYAVGRRRYEIGMVSTANGGYYRYAAVRLPEPGEGMAQRVADDLIDDLDPRWLLLIGIGGGVPSTDFSLGDVICATRVHDFCVRAVTQEEHEKFSGGGGPMHPEVQSLLGSLPSIVRRLTGWNRSDAIGMVKPGLHVPPAQSDCYYGDDSWKVEVHRTLQYHFPSGGQPRPPLVTSRSVASSDALVKSTELMRQWQEAARSVAAVEMELAGVYLAARRINHEYPVLAVRAISDIVGFRREEHWTKYACQTAAAFALALLRSGEIFQTTSQVSNAAPRNLSRRPAPEKTAPPQSAASGIELPGAYNSEDKVLFYPADYELLDLSQATRNRQATQHALGILTTELRILVLAIPPEGCVIIPPTYYLESRLCRELLQAHASLIDCGYIKLVTQFINLEDYLVDKRERYGKAARFGRYKDAYYSGMEKGLYHLNVQLTSKAKSVGKDALSLWDREIRQRAALLSYPNEIIEEFRKRVLETEQAAFLYENVAEHMDALGIASKDAKALQIRESTSRTYLDSYIQQGIVVPNGSEVITDLVIPVIHRQEYNIRKWRRMYEMSGLLGYINSRKPEDIIRIKTRPDVAMVIARIRELFAENEKSDTVIGHLIREKLFNLFVTQFTQN